MKILRRFFAASIKKKDSPALKVINSHEKLESRSEVDKLNEIRFKQIKEYQKEMAAARRSHAQYSKTLPTRSQIETEKKKERAEKRNSTWKKYVEGLKKCWNPPVNELQANGKIPKRDEARRAEKSERGRVNLMQAMKSTVLMRRKYLNYLSTEVIPTLVTAENLDAKIQEALDSDRGNVFNTTAEMVIEGEKEVKRKLREIRVPLDEYERELESNASKREVVNN